MVRGGIRGRKLDEGLLTKICMCVPYLGWLFGTTFLSLMSLNICIFDNW
jgi:hypothetical protein